MTATPRQSLVQTQFGPRADAYVESAVHAGGPDLDALDAILAALKPEHAVDLGTGGGHVAYRMARHAARVTAVDVSADMLAAVAASAAERGLANLETREAAAEALPFADASFDALASRFSLHHWGDADRGLREARRVLADGSTAVFMDSMSPGVPALDTHLQAVELLRDPSHVRNYTLAEWQGALVRAGFLVRGVTVRRLRMDYPVWIERMRTPPAHQTAIRSLQRLASLEVARHFAIEGDGSFLLDTLQIEAVAA